MPETQPTQLTAARAAALIRAKQLSPVEYTQAVLDQAGRRADLNAFATLLPEQALAAARAAEQAVMDGRPLGPLHGVPVSVKDQVDMAGVVTGHGSAVYADNTAAGDDILVRRLREAGAIIFGKTRLPEFGHKGLTDSPVYGLTANPWDTSRTAGGSSGGAAVAVAAGIGPVALGTDGAGSVRIPAACCGLVGLKPTLGTLPWQQGSDTFGNYTYAGPMTRSVTDAAVMFTAMAGPSPADPWSLAQAGSPPRLNPALAGNDLSGLRIGYIERATNPRLAADMAEATRRSLAVLEGLGAVVTPVTDPIDWIEFPARILYQANYAVSMARHLPQWQDRMDPVLLAFVERGNGFGLHEFRQGQYARTRLFRSIQALFERFDLLVTPTLSRTALPADFDAADDEVEVEGELCGITRQGWSSYVYPFNLTGHPALTVPNGFGTDGLPTAVQLVGPWGGDLDLLRLAGLLEAAAPWADYWPPGA
ncbi:amidase [Roseomonas sp. USHLN139]|uniref:amidase n=1 Tax=Roseomonas sp. USHLN139 TaxID=3081298 RepID=UPI003B01026A